MATSLWEYFEERKAECERLGLRPLAPEYPGYFEREGSSERRGRIFMKLSVDEDANAVLAVSERVVVHQRYVHREEYGYYLLIDGQEYCAWDYDAIHGYHGHAGPDHKRIVRNRVTFKEVAEAAWEIVSQEAELADTKESESDESQRR